MPLYYQLTITETADRMDWSARPFKKNHMDIRPFKKTQILQHLFPPI